MADEIDVQADEINRTDKRLTDLSSKVKETATERDNALRQVEEATRERDFYASFSEMVPKYSEASAFKDQIKDKVMKGYSVEDATVSVLNAEGKLIAPSVDTPPAPPGPAAGGSALYSPPLTGDKTLGEMSRDEKRQKLIELDQQGDPLMRSFQR